MAKKITGYVKLQVPAGKANPSPPVGPALGQAGLNIMEFCKAFNAETQQMEQGAPLPVVITVYQDKTFSFVFKKTKINFKASFLLINLDPKDIILALLCCLDNLVDLKL